MLLPGHSIHRQRQLPASGHPRPRPRGSQPLAAAGNSARHLSQQIHPPRRQHSAASEPVHRVNNYLMGHKPPVFDVLSWNADGKNLPAALHLQFLDLSRQTRSAAPARWRSWTRRVDLATITVPAFATERRPITLTPWKGCLPHHPAAVRADDIRAQQQRAHPEPGQPPGNPKASYTGQQPATILTSGSRPPPGTPGPGGRPEPTGSPCTPLRRGTGRLANSGQSGLRTDDGGPGD